MHFTAEKVTFLLECYVWLKAFIFVFVIQLPPNISNSVVLSEAEKQLLASVDAVPVVNPAFEDDKLKNIFQYYSLIPDEMDLEVHKYASELLHDEKINEAWQVLLSTDIVWLFWKFTRKTLLLFQPKLAFLETSPFRLNLIQIISSTFRFVITNFALVKLL